MGENHILRFYPHTIFMADCYYDTTFEKYCFFRGYLTERDKEVIKHNKKVSEIISEINKLEHWEDYVEFKGHKYGLPHVLDGRHRTNDCLGKVIKIWSNLWCQYDEKCEKCGFID